MMRKLSVILTFLTLPAWGHNFTKDFNNGFYWQNLPVKMTVMDSDSARKARLENLTQQAMGEWQSRTGKTLWNFVIANGGAPTSNIIRWSTNFAAETGMDASTVLAVTIRYTEGPYFAKAEIVINGNHPQLAYNSNILTTLTHELGHTQGLDHSSDMSAVMAPTLQNPYYGLANDDITGMEAAFEETDHRQLIHYISPLASSKQTTSKSPLSCGTIGVATPGASTNGLLSLSVGMLIGFVRKAFRWVKSLL
jgi:hypothetical protein